MSRWIKGLLLAMLLLAAGGAGFWFGRDLRQAPAADPPADKGDESTPAVAQVQTQPLETGTIEQTVEEYGSIQPAPGSSINISVPFDAKVNRVLVAPGATVESGTPVVELGPTPDVQLQFLTAQNALTGAQRNLDQVRRRLAEQLATNADVAAAEQAQQAAQTQLDNLNRRGLQDARTLTAGTAGIVAQVSVQAGQVIPAGTALVVISPPQSGEAIVGVEPSAADLLEQGASVDLWRTDAPPDSPAITGRIRLIAHQINPQTRLRDVSITLPPKSPLVQGMFVTADLTIATASGLIVPRSAVLPDGDDQIIFTVTDDKAKRHVVAIGAKNRTQVQILSDELHAGDLIVVTGNAELEDGMAVRTAPPATAPATSPSTTQSAEGK